MANEIHAILLTRTKKAEKIAQNPKKEIMFLMNFQLPANILWIDLKDSVEMNSLKFRPNGNR